jgi:methylmalonyl-CoA/ethylmalonyl-CoA epimerase
MLRIMQENFNGLKIDHLGIAVRNLDEATAPYRLLGLERVGEDEVITSQNVKVRVLKVGESLLELLEPTSPESPIAGFLEKKGEGLHHVAFRVENLEAEIERLVKENAQFIGTEPRAGRAGTRVVFLHPKWAKGVLVELVEHKSRREEGEQGRKIANIPTY